MKTNIVIADDNSGFRGELRRLIHENPDFHLVGEASNGREAVMLAVENDADVVIIDVVMPSMNGIDAARRILELMPRVKIVAVSMHAKETYKRAMMRVGASAYVTKNKLGSELLPVLGALREEFVSSGGMEYAG